MRLRGNDYVGGMGEPKRQPILGYNFWPFVYQCCIVAFLWWLSHATGFADWLDRVIDFDGQTVIDAADYFRDNN